MPTTDVSRKEEAPAAPLMANVLHRISTIKQERLKELQMKPLPVLPNNRRAAPNAVVRSSAFGVVKRGKRSRVTDMPVAGPHGSEITITGWRLDQYDFDVWLEIMHAAGGSKLGGQRF